MPIEFQPAMPLSGFADAQAYGALQQDERNRQFQFQTSQAQARESDLAADRNQRGYEFDAQQQQQQELQQQHYQQQEQMARLQNQLQGDLSQQRLTQAETLRMQRMQNSIGEINASDTLRDDEKASLIMQLQTGLNPLLQRQQAQRMQEEQQAAQQRQQMFQEHLNQIQSQERFRSQNAADAIIRLPDPDQPGEHLPGLYVRNHTGDIVPLASEGTARGSSRGSGGNNADMGFTDEAYVRERQRIVSEVQREAHDHQLDSWGTRTTPGTLWGTNETRNNIEQEVARRMHDLGLAPTLLEHQSDRPTARPTPIPMGTPSSRMTPMQREGVNAFQESRRRLRVLSTRRGLQGGAATQALTQAEMAFRRYGSRDAMPGPVRRAYDQALNTAASVLDPGGWNNDEFDQIAYGE